MRKAAARVADVVWSERDAESVLGEAGGFARRRIGFGGSLGEFDCANVVVAFVGLEPPAGRESEMVGRLFERAVLEHFGGQAAFDILGHHLDEGSVHARADVVFDAVRIEAVCPALNEALSRNTARGFTICSSIDTSFAGHVPGPVLSRS